jgi:hypothetical protein
MSNSHALPQSLQGVPPLMSAKPDYDIEQPEREV